jgi:hypothetical protein
MPFDTGSLLDAIDFWSWYAAHPLAIDGLIYLVLGLGLARVGLERHFDGRGGTAVIAGLGIALAIGTASLARSVGFTLAELGPVAWALLILVIGAAGYGVLHHL